MEKWYQTIWGILLLGALGSILGAVLLKVISILINKIGLNILIRISSNLLIPYAENKHFVKMCEENNQTYLIPMKYSMTMSKYSRVQLVFIFMFGLSCIAWLVYNSNDKLPILAPIILTLMAIRDLYDFIKWYVAITGSYPSEYKKYRQHTYELIKEDKIRFIKNMLEDKDS
jgi:hypothetical protein